MSPTILTAAPSTRRLCFGKEAVFDELQESKRPDPEVKRAAQNMCATCLLTTPDIARPCLRAAKGERWRKHVLDPRPLTIVEQSPRKARIEERVTRIRAMISDGAGVTQVADHLGLTRNGLWMWLDRHGFRTEWEQLAAEDQAAVS